jgi:hypothetical protein
VLLRSSLSLLSNRQAAGWEAYKLTVEEQLRRGTWCDYFYSFWPFGVKKKRSQRTREERQAARQQGNRNGGGGGGGGGRGKKNNWVEKNDGNGQLGLENKAAAAAVVALLLPSFVAACLPFFFFVFNHGSQSHKKTQPDMNQPTNGLLASTFHETFIRLFFVSLFRL